MKEVTEWNNQPREMWVWDDNLEDKRKRFVIYIDTEGFNSNPNPVITFSPIGGTLMFEHCAEIEYRKFMTNKELARWLAEKPDRECKCGDFETVSHLYSYSLQQEDKEIPSDVLVREGDEPWHKPLAKEE